MRIQNRRRPLWLAAFTFALALSACVDDPGPLSPDAQLTPSFAKGGNGGNGGNGGPGSGSTGAAQIAFTGTGSGVQLYTVSPDGSNLQPIAKGADAAEPTWSPDRKKIAYIGAGAGDLGLFTMTLNNGKTTKLYPYEARSPRWSPDGSRIAFVALSGYNEWRIAVVNANGGSPQFVTPPTAMQDIEPTWSPDSRRIAFLSRRTGAWEVWAMNADGSSPTQVTTCLADGVSCSNPNWSPVPGDNRIALTYNAGGVRGIAIAAATGGWLDGLAHAYHGTDMYPTWSPDGSKLAFISRQSGSGRNELYTVNANGSDIRLIAAPAGINIFTPAWAR